MGRDAYNWRKCRRMVGAPEGPGDLEGDNDRDGDNDGGDDSGSKDAGDRLELAAPALNVAGQ